MPIDLQVALPGLVRFALVWAEAVSAHAAASGDTLSKAGIAIARSVGVQFPERIRVALFNELPIPTDLGLEVAIVQTGLITRSMSSLTLGYSILVCSGHLSRSTLSYECRHVHQYEKAGGIRAFLPVYLNSIFEVGMWNSPFENDARMHQAAYD